VSNAILPALRPAELDGQELRPLDFGAFAWRRKAAGSWFVMATQSAQFDPRVPSSDWLTHVAYELDEALIPVAISWAPRVSGWSVSLLGNSPATYSEVAFKNIFKNIL
jgi:hypothetical protein